jgi:hypothetical protein
MIGSVLLCAALAVGQAPANAAGGAAPVTPETPYPQGRTLALPDVPSAGGPPGAIPSLFGGADVQAPFQGGTLSLPASLFPSPANPAPAAAPAAPAEPPRRAMPSPFLSPPLPGSEYQGYPIIGLPPDYTIWPLMQALQGTPLNTALVDHKVRVYGWITAEGNLSTSKNSNTPDSYWIRPNNVDMDQAIIRFERNPDTVQTDHIDFGFRSTFLYGIDYRYMTAGGWFSDQLLVHNFLYGFDPTEQYIDVYVPWVAQGLIVRVGRWIACPDIETQFAPDNYMGSHSILFTFDTYTQTGVMLTFMLNKQWTFQAAIHSGTDMAPWYPGSLATGAFGIRWVSKSNNDAFYGWLNAINDAEFRYYMKDGQLVGHDNFNYWVQTWEHRFNQYLSTKTESYFMWQKNAVVGGTPSIGPVEPFGGGGGLGAFIPGTTFTWGVLNYTELIVGHRDYITFRNEYWKDTDGERSGFRGVYTSNAIGWSHNFTPYFQIRPEIDYFRNWTTPAFDNGRRQNQFMLATDVTLRF